VTGAAGFSDGRLSNCVLNGNSSGYQGGGAFEGTLHNCALTGNSSGYQGGGAHGGRLYNCIVYYNSASLGANHSVCTLDNCCTTPLPAGGIGNLEVEPELASASHLSANSPCRGAGNPLSAGAVDVDGESWLNPPSIGCDEYHSGSVTGALSVAIVASHSQVTVGFGADFDAHIIGRVSGSRWEFGDGMVVSNRPYARHAWTRAGNYAVVLRAQNESHPAGVTATVMVQVVSQPVHYVSLSSASPSAPIARGGRLRGPFRRRWTRRRWWGRWCW